MNFSSSHQRHAFRAGAIALCFASVSFQASADEYEEVMRLSDAKQYASALEQIGRYLQKKPNEPQMRFLKGIVETDAGKTDEAAVTFLKLTEDYPTIPEPYNNMAVLYASQKKYERALTALETAVRIKPDYGKAHENLADVHARLAGQSYARALSIGGAQAGSAIQPKLSLISAIFEGRMSPVVPIASATTESAAAAIVPLPSTQPTQKKSPAKDPVVANDADAETAVRKWAAAWAAKDVDAYLASYAADFVPANSQTRKAWETERRARITGKSRIELKLQSLKITLDGDRASARFVQHYSADSLNLVNNKTLHLHKSNGGWLIVREVS